MLGLHEVWSFSMTLIVKPLTPLQKKKDFAKNKSFEQ